jgi:ABC-type proline/glycine betaine transport system ATPase subunit
MDECQALCNRIGFMNKGTLISIGSSQHLKSRYSTSFMLTFTLANPCAFSARYLNSLVTREFDVSYLLYYKYKIWCLDGRHIRSTNHGNATLGYPTSKSVVEFSVPSCTTHCGQTSTHGTFTYWKRNPAH